MVIAFDDQPTLRPLLPCTVNVGQDVDLDSWRLIVPAKPATYLLCDADDRPVLLATAGNLRNVLVNRLGPDLEATTTKRTDYRSITRRVWWRPAYSAFEANWALLENARTLMPKRYRRMIRHWHGWWLHVDTDAPFPRFTQHREPTDKPGQWVGPIPTRTWCCRVIDTLIDLCELCRYHEILTKAPDGQPCAYKEMGRCPAPCDGTVSMDHYRDQIQRALALIVGGLEPWQAQTQSKMKQAATDLAFEKAQQIKGDLEKARTLAHRDLELAGPLGDMKYLVLQRGRRKGQPRLFAVGPGLIALIGELTRHDRDVQLDWAAQRMSKIFEQNIGPIAREQAERIGLVSWHLLRGEREKGTWIKIDNPQPVRLRQIIVEALERRD